jgi:predicted ATPase/class 3 adenylate cyclase
MDDGDSRTFLFTDIVGSTALWERHGTRMEEVLERHDVLVRSVVEDHVGRVFAGGGDGFGSVFGAPMSGLEAAIAAQRALDDLEVGGDTVRVRMGLHTGPAHERGGDYFGISVNRAARIASAAHGGQVLLSETTAERVGPASLVRLGEFRLTDLLEPVVIYQAGTAEFPPIRALDPEKHNLPVRFTSLIGRDALIDTVIRALEESRLVTLVGPGGIGKTSVALEVAARLVPTTQRGVWLAELDALPLDGEVEQAIAGVLGMARIEGWRRTAAGRDQVLLLDNAEHVVDSAAQAATALLRAGTAIRLLVTSREPLNVPGETVIDVPPLDSSNNADLFVDRCSAILAEDIMVEEVLRRTDGLPLATELIAAHSGRLPMREIIRSLDEQGVAAFRVRGGSDRHRSIRSAVAWSYNLLSAPERTAFEALAVFGGTFPTNRAAQLAAVPSDAIRGLVEKSLVQPAGDDRFQLLEPIRQCARDILIDRQGIEEIQQRHATLIADAVTAIAKQVAPCDLSAWSTAFDLPVSELIAAMGWAAERADLELLTRLYVALPGLPLGADRGEEALDRLAPAISIFFEEPARFRWELYRHAWTEDMCWREAAAREKVLLLQSLPEVKGDPHLNAACSLVHLKTHQGMPGPIELQEALAAEVKAFEGEPQWWTVPVPDWYLAGAYQRTGDLARARERFTEVLRQATTEIWSANALIGLAYVEREIGNPSRSIAILEDVETADPGIAREVAQERAHAFVVMGQADQAREQLMPLVAWDLSHAQPTTMSFCATADYLRGIGDHRHAVWLLSKMLGGGDPVYHAHRRVIDQAKAHLGEDAFHREWARGRDMDIYELYRMLEEQL